MTATLVSIGQLQQFGIPVPYKFASLLHAWMPRTNERFPKYKSNTPTGSEHEERLYLMTTQQSALPHSFDHQQLIERLGLAWVSPPSFDLNEDYVEFEGEIERHPSADQAEQALADLGFACSASGAGRSTTIELLGKKGIERLTCYLLPASTYKGRPIHGERIRIIWKSGRRPRINGSEFEWHGRLWPVFFDEANVYHKSGSLLILEGTLSPNGFPNCCNQYRQWAESSGFAPHRPFEPDMAGDLDVADEGFTVKVQDRGRYVTLSVQSREHDA